MEELRSHGFVVDWTENLEEVTRERVRSFDTLVLFTSPASFGRSAGGVAPGSEERFTEVVSGFAEGGGGVFLMPDEPNLGVQRLRALTDRWGATIPAERIIEEDSARRSEFERASFSLPLAYTNSVTPSPITAGVSGIWYPMQQAFLGGLTLPIIVDASWQVLVRASPTARAEPISLGDWLDAAPGLVQRTESERAPPLFAVRSAGHGRVALMAQWPQFSFAAGTKWLYDRVVLERGARGIPSDMRRLLENTLRWLSEPSLQHSQQRSVRRLEHVNAARDANVALYRTAPPPYDVSTLQTARVPDGQRVYRGLIGARTFRSGGSSSVQEYAASARQAGLDFVVFLEDFPELAEDELRSLQAECDAQSDAKELLLLAGFSARTNVGNKVFFFGPRLSWPPDSVLTGKNGRTLHLQQELPDGTFTGLGRTQFQEWALRGASAGYYDFRDATALRMYDARIYALAGVRYYESGRQIEDATDDYLLTNAGTIGPTPVTVHMVKSAQELAAQARSQRGLTYVVASSLALGDRAGVEESGLKWKSQFDFMRTFVSSGPEVLVWPQTFRSMTYGAEGFAPERSVMFAPLVLKSKVGLRDISIYDGNTLYRRVALRGAKTFETTFVLEGSLQRDLVVIATDVRGGSAVSFPARSWSDGSDAPVFCSDHTNDCKSQPLLARGPFSLPLSYEPILPLHVAGLGWDGAPHGAASALGRQQTLPTVYTKSQAFSASAMTAVPLLDFSDEGATGVTALRTREFDHRLAWPLLPWSAFGPLSARTAPFEYRQHFRQWVAHSAEAPPYGHLAFSVRHGAQAALFSSELEYRRELDVEGLQVASFLPRAGTTVAVLPVDAEPIVFELDANAPREHALRPGDALAVFGKQPVNAHLIINRGEPVVLQAREELRLMASGPARRVRAGDRYGAEFISLAFPLTHPVTAVADILPALQYLRDPPLTVLRGRRIASHGVVDLEPSEGAVELSAPRAPFPGPTPMRVSRLNPRWSAGLLMKRGSLIGFYGAGQDRYRSLGVSAQGMAHVPLDSSAAETHVVAGHPIIADAAGADLFIQVTCLGGSPYRWHVAANNPTSHRVTTTLRTAMDLPGLTFQARTLSLAPGELVNLQ
jgi:hypothetical protein